VTATEPPGQQAVDLAEMDLLLHKWADRIAHEAADKLRAADPVTFDAVSDTVRELVEATTFAGAVGALQAFIEAPGLVDPDKFLAYLREQT
jgi:hypothetical protein